MELETEFIENLNLSYSTKKDKVACYDDEKVHDCIIQYNFRIWPGLKGTKDGSTYFNIKDRNLKEGKDYDPATQISINTEKLSFSKIQLVNVSFIPGHTVPNNKPFVAELVSDGRITDVYKFPLDDKIAEAHKVFGKQEYMFTNRGIKFTDSNYNPCSSHESSRKNFYGLINSYLDLSNKDYILVGIKTNTINPYDESLITGFGSTNVIFKAWYNWITLSHGAKDYCDNDVVTFRKFLEKIILADILTDKFDEDDREILKRFIQITKNKLSIGSDGVVKLNGEDVYSALDNKKIISFGTFIGENDDGGWYSHYDKEFYAYYGTSIHNVLMSNVGDVNKFVKATQDSKYEKYKMCDYEEAKTIFSPIIYEDLYVVAVSTDRIHFNSFTIVQDNKLYFYKKALKSDKQIVSLFELHGVTFIESNKSEQIALALDKEVQNVDYITPSEYYGNIISFGEFTNENEGYAAIRSDGDTDVPSWFWLDTLANWCIFRQYQGKNIYKLYVWNGKNTWNCFEDVLMHPDNYNYDISNMKFGIKFSCEYECGHLPIDYSVVVLKYDNNFAQYNGNNFQTIRIGKIWSDNIKSKRYPYTIGIPPIMRLSSGEIGLLYSIRIPGANNDHPVIFPENVKFLNSVCRACFGDGEDKTIKDDWKRVEKKIIKDDLPGVIVSSKESSLVNADEINTVKDATVAACMEFIPFKQYIETDNIGTEAYIERWN